MGRRGKHYEKIVSGSSDANIPFEQTRTLLGHLGFTERVRGSHHVFSREDVEEIINLQKIEGGKCKAYQVRQMREVLLKYNFEEEL